MYFRVMKWNTTLHQWDGTCWGVRSDHPNRVTGTVVDDLTPTDFSWVRLTQERAKEGLHTARQGHSDCRYTIQKFEDGEPDA